MGEWSLESIPTNHNFIIQFGLEVLSLQFGYFLKHMPKMKRTFSHSFCFLSLQIL